MGFIENVNQVAQGISVLDLDAIDSLNTNMDDIVAVGDNILSVNTVSSNIANVNIVALADSNVSIVAANYLSVDTVAGVAEDITTVATNVVPNLAEILLASDNAAIATQAKNETVALYDMFDDRFLGSKSTAPTLDNDGDPLVSGTLYWDTTLLQLRVYDGIVWSNALTLTESSESILVNKTINDYSNKVHADATHQRVKALEPILKGQPVMFTSYNSGQDAVEVNLADQDVDVSIGIAEYDMDTNEFGVIISFGIIDGLDTSMYTAGSILYVNGSGALTATEPTSGFAQPIAFVVREHGTQGALLINASYPKQDASDVRVTPVGTVAATNVQSAIQELDTEIQSHAPYIGGTTERNTVLSGGLKLDTTTTKGFAATAYTGNGSVQWVVTDVDMVSDDNGGLLWIKDRDGSGDEPHILLDSVRGEYKFLSTNLTNQDVDSTIRVKSLSSDGFRLDYSSYVNADTENYVAWSFQTTRKSEPVYSAEIFADPNFDDAAQWTLGTGWSVSGGVASITTGTYAEIKETVNELVDGETYTFEITVDSSSSGINVRYWDGTQHVPILDLANGDTGTFRKTFTVSSTSDARVKINAANVVLSSVSLKQLDTTSNVTDEKKPVYEHYNPEMGFAIVGVENAGVTSNVPHHLGYDPEVMISKCRTESGDWHVNIGGLVGHNNGNLLKLNKIDAATNFSTGSDTDEFQDALFYSSGGAVDGSLDIHYLFRSVPGFSKIRTYVGNGDSSNVINLGLDMTASGSMCIIKRLDDVGDWKIYDNARDILAGGLEANTANGDDTTFMVSFTSSGINLVSTDSHVNAAGGRYLIMAFTANYEKATTGIPYVQDGTIVTHAEGFDENGAKDFVHTLSQQNVAYQSDDNKYVYIKDVNSTVGQSHTPPTNAYYKLDVETMVPENPFVYLGEIKWMDGKAFAVEPAPRISYIQEISDGTNSVTPAELRSKLDEPQVGVDGKMAVAYCYLDTVTGAISRSFNVSASIVNGTGDVTVYFTDSSLQALLGLGMAIIDGYTVTGYGEGAGKFRIKVKDNSNVSANSNIFIVWF